MAHKISGLDDRSTQYGGPDKWHGVEYGAAPLVTKETKYRIAGSEFHVVMDNDLFTISNGGEYDWKQEIVLKPGEALAIMLLLAAYLGIARDGDVDALADKLTKGV
jgi:hypothetical protein